MSCSGFLLNGKTHRFRLLIGKLAGSSSQHFPISQLRADYKLDKQLHGRKARDEETAHLKGRRQAEYSRVRVGLGPVEYFYHISEGGREDDSADGNPP